MSEKKVTSPDEAHISTTWNDHHMENKKYKMCGWLLIISVLLTIVTSLVDPRFKFVPGTLIWISAFLFLPDLSKIQLKQVMFLIIFGLTGLIVGFIYSHDYRYILKGIEANQTVISMLISVGFLRVFLAGSLKSDDHLPTGKSALIKTLIGTHLLGSVINMSSVIIIGDRIANNIH